MTTPQILETKTAECRTHGTYTDELIESFSGDHFWQGCKRCQFDAAHSNDEMIRKAALTTRHQRTMNAGLLASDIPLRFRAATLDNYRVGSHPEGQGTALSECRKYVDEFEANWDAGRSMMLLGSVGTGKSHLACAIAQQVIRSYGASARYTMAIEIIRDIKMTFDKKSEQTERDVYASLLKPDLLVIDEVGVQHGSDFERQVLFEVIDSRYRQLMPTIVISNLGLAGLRKCLGDRAVDRLTDAGGPAVLFTWASARGEA
ncbi:ATP-binding protein [Pseudomonas plecoglossicida]|uniref:ATP-binding protein n=1 Tax=Pseudomonas putida group TaxID=136845 RepID=UPI0002E65D10|nr:MULTISPECIES: ATP-binding protein [Pseudomonas putida group]ANC82980.1 ATP-binding protein [Pseudomonas putida B6-2]MDQ7965643.1 ATP-binding protein [Pseudomonas plecoglossicida]WFG04479.1 ATP-binding protein [Pseudomonas putida]